MKKDNVQFLFQDGVKYKKDGNIIHFILDDANRPEWSKALERFFQESGRALRMGQNYKSRLAEYKKSEPLQQLFAFITVPGGVIIDLASGPSGYFAPALELLKPDSLFVATDACPSVISTHAAINEENNFCVLDVDLDKPFPLKNETVDVFSGNLLNNVENYKELIQEAYRCLKTGGRFAAIELFFENGSTTYDYLIKRDAVYSSFETYVHYFEKTGFHYLGGELLRETVGKISKGDLLPIGEKDKSVVRTLFFEKRGIN